MKKEAAENQQARAESGQLEQGTDGGVEWLRCRTETALAGGLFAKFDLFWKGHS